MKTKDNLKIEEENEEQQKYSFTLLCKQKPYYVAGRTKQESKEWIDAIIGSSRPRRASIHTQ